MTLMIVDRYYDIEKFEDVSIVKKEIVGKVKYLHIFFKRDTENYKKFNGSCNVQLLPSDRFTIMED